MEGRNTCLYMFAEARMLVVLVCCVLLDQGIVAVGVNPLISVEQVLRVGQHRVLNIGDGVDVTLAFVKRSETEGEKDMVHKVLKEAWNLYEKQKQRFLRFQWKDGMPARGYGMFVAFSTKFPEQLQKDVKSTMLEENGNAFLGVMTRAQFDSHRKLADDECECLAAFMVIPDRKELEVKENTEHKEELETLRKMLGEYMEEDGRNGPECYIYSKEEDGCRYVNPLLSFGDVAQATSKFFEYEGNSGDITLHVLPATKSDVDKKMVKEALRRGWALLLSNKDKTEERFFSFEWKDEGISYRMWVAVSGDKELVGRYGEEMVNVMQEAVDEEKYGNALVGGAVDGNASGWGGLGDEIVVAFMVTGPSCVSSSDSSIKDAAQKLASFETKLHRYLELGSHKPKPISLSREEQTEA